jgi:hypothetical protein
MSEVTRVLSALEWGDPRAAEKLVPLVYDELRKLAAQRLGSPTPWPHFAATARRRRRRWRSSLGSGGND